MRVGWNRWTASLLVLLIWAAIYLPALGSVELRGEEGRRIMPAVSMLQTGDWVVPKLGGEYYYKKPPLIQWLIAASFELTGRRTDLTARLPSVLSVLAFALALVHLPLRWMGLDSRFVGALVFLTNIGLVTKGRLIEIEASLISLTGVTSLVWLHLFTSGASAWALWSAFAVLAGAGLLLKGPIILFFLYGLILPVYVTTGRARELRRAAPWLGLLGAVAIFGVWALLAAREAPGDTMTHTWFAEMSEQALPSEGMNLRDWGEKLVKSLGNFAPWLLLLPLLWSRIMEQVIPEEQRGLFRGCRWSLAFCFLTVFLVPGSMPRYTMPVIPLACLLLGWILADSSKTGLAATNWRRFLATVTLVAAFFSVVGWFLFSLSVPAVVVSLGFAVLAWLLLRPNCSLTSWPRLAVMTGCMTVLGILAYTVHGVPLARHEESRRQTAALLDRMIPGGERLYVFRAESLPMLFYLQVPVGFVNAPREIGPDVRYLLVRDRDAQQLHDGLASAGRRIVNVEAVSGMRTGKFELLHLSPAPVH